MKRSNISRVIGACALSVFANAPSAHTTVPDTGQPAAMVRVPPSEPSAPDVYVKVVCEMGFIPLAVEADLKGVLVLAGSQVSFSGGHGRLAYCNVPSPASKLAMEKASKKVALSHATASASATGGAQLLCQQGELPFAFEGSAEGVLNTNKGQVKLQGDHNRVLACLVPPKEA